MKFYTRNDFWLQVEAEDGPQSSGVARIGLTDFGQAELGELVFVELPAVGRRVEAGQAFGVVESVKAVAELKSPVGGEICAVNQAVVDNPELANDAPESAGWLVEIKLLDVGEIRNSSELLNADAYKTHRPSWQAAS